MDEKERLSGHISHANGAFCIIKLLSHGNHG